MQKLADQEKISSIDLDPKHPGIHDPAYIQRRTDFYNLSRHYRLHHNDAPLVDYHPHEHAVWQHIYTKLNDLHQQKACQIYLEGKDALGLSPDEVPQLKLLSDHLQRTHDMKVVSVEGLLDTREFFGYLANRTMPATQFLRHHSDPEYTPEPDIVHDVLGHIPPLMNPEYTALMELIGHCCKGADEETITAVGRIYWFAVEFGLILERDELKVFGAGILSSYGEMNFCFSDEVERKPFNLEEVIHTDYDPTQMQRKLFYIPSFEFLSDEIKKFFQKH